MKEFVVFLQDKQNSAKEIIELQTVSMFLTFWHVPVHATPLTFTHEYFDIITKWTDIVLHSYSL